MIKVLTQSDVFEQVKPDKLSYLQDRMQDGSKWMKYPFKYFPNYHKDETWSTNTLKFTIAEVYELLSKALRIVENTEEYTEYVFNKTFGENKHYYTPPGTVRFYSPDLICFFNGKACRKIKP